MAPRDSRKTRRTFLLTPEYLNACTLATFRGSDDSCRPSRLTRNELLVLVSSQRSASDMTAAAIVFAVTDKWMERK